MQTLNEAFTRYRLEVLPTLGERTQKDYARHLTVLERTFGHLEPNALKPIYVGAFLDRPKGKIQANRQVAVLSAVYAKLVGRWYQADRNPCIGVERNPSHPRTRYVTDGEFEAMRTVCSHSLKLAMDLALLTGQRQGDLIALQFKNVSDEGIYFQQGKTGKKLLVAMSPALTEVIERSRRQEPLGPTVIRTRKGNAYTSEGFRAMWQRACQRATKRSVLDVRFRFHDIRAKTVSDSTTLEEAFARAGHTSMTITRSVYDRGVRKVTPLK